MEETENVERRSKSTRRSKWNAYMRETVSSRGRQNHKEAGNICGFLARNLNVLCPLRRGTRVFFSIGKLSDQSSAIEMSNRWRHASCARTLVARDVHCSSNSFGATFEGWMSRGILRKTYEDIFYIFRSLNSCPIKVLNDISYIFSSIAILAYARDVWMYLV